MLSCRHATTLASAALDRPLSRRERIALRTHLIICSSCRRAARQFRRLRTVARSVAEPDARTEPAAAPPMPDVTRRRLADGLTDSDDA